MKLIDKIFMSAMLRVLTDALVLGGAIVTIGGLVILVLWAITMEAI